MEGVKKIVIIGPESSGKSTLSSQLAGHYQTIWCPEYARDYLTEKGRHYNYDDLLNIAKGQQSLEEKLLPEAKNGLYFIDTNQYVMKIWCEMAFGQCHSWILQQIAKNHYDLYLLCKPDILWVEDELREYPDSAFRHKLYLMYKDLLVNNGTPWAEIDGEWEGRLQKAIESIHQNIFK
jgi:NadR type nicotinamide-nucleotide adenylyltransferase